VSDAVDPRWLEGDEVEFRAALIARSQLSTQAVNSTIEHMTANGQDFADAAFQLELVTVDDLEDARAYAMMVASGDTPSLVETALRRLASTRRDLVVRQHPPVTPGPRLVIVHEPFSLHSEKIRALRTDLLLLSEAQSEAAVIAVVSPGPGEGRTHLAAELAISFAQLGRQTMLIDADLRNPGQHTLFDTGTAAGLTDALLREDHPMLHPVVDMPKLWLLTAGTPVPNPLELLSDGRFQHLLAGARKAYEFIVIDTPPVSRYADALAVTTIAGRALFVSRVDHTTYADARSTLRRLDATQAAVLGAVLNRF
jgi:protein-tyrosine kinase